MMEATPIPVEPAPAGARTENPAAEGAATATAPAASAPAAARADGSPPVASRPDAGTAEPVGAVRAAIAADQPFRAWFLTRVLRPASDLRITVACFAAGIFLVFAGTLAQVDEGIWTVVGRYFRSFWVLIPLQIFFPRSIHVSGGLFFPGGWLIGGVFLVNLLAAHTAKFKLAWNRAGILFIHAGIVLMLLGEIVTGVFAVEGNMSIDEGGSSYYVEHIRTPELAIIDPSEPREDVVTVVPGSLLRTRTTIAHDDLPFDVEVAKYMANSEILEPFQAKGEPNPATAGNGLEVVAVARPEVSGTDANQAVDAPSAYLALRRKGSGAPLGTWLVSLWLGAQTVPLDGKVYSLTLRHKRSYRPFRLELIDFRHDRYLGTDIPKNFSSQVRLVDPVRGVDREVLISMNQPLRYAGETFYQSSYKPDGTGTVLQVVRNPGWLLPYISCVMVAAGMLWHFGMHLVGFLRRRSVT